MTREERTEFLQAYDDTRRVVKSLMRHARTATQMLTDLQERLDAYERDELRHHRAQEAPNGTPPREHVRA